VAAGTTVDIRLEDGTMKTFTILGEWDRDEQLNIISNKTAMALSLIGKKTGDFTMIPGSDGEVKAEITAVHPLDSTIKEWIAATPTTA
jgi:transcription elongation GreA/GreB family factor